MPFKRVNIQEETKQLIESDPEFAQEYEKTQKALGYVLKTIPAICHTCEYKDECGVGDSLQVRTR